MASPSEEPPRKTWGDYYLSMFDGTLADAWFRWAEWLLVTAALYVAGNVTGSIVLKAVAYISGGLTLFYVLGRIDDFNDVVFPHVRRLRPLIRFVAITGIAVVLWFVVVAISNAINAIFSDKLLSP